MNMDLMKIFLEKPSGQQKKVFQEFSENFFGGIFRLININFKLFRVFFKEYLWKYLQINGREFIKNIYVRTSDQ